MTWAPLPNKQEAASAAKERVNRSRANVKTWTVYVRTASGYNPLQ